MLVLTRKMHETIRIGENITISILRVKGNAVRVGIDAPRQVRVVRGELPPAAERTTSGVESAEPESRGECGPCDAQRDDSPSNILPDIRIASVW